MTDAYPTYADLGRIAQWPHDDVVGWFVFIKSLWWAVDWGWNEEDSVGRSGQPKQKVRYYDLSTGGWSGNEELMNAMAQNKTLWAITWRCSRRGGHYAFECLL